MRQLRGKLLWLKHQETKEGDRFATLVDCEGRIYCEMLEQASTRMVRSP